MDDNACVDERYEKQENHPGFLGLCDFVLVEFIFRFSLLTHELISVSALDVMDDAVSSIIQESAQDTGNVDMRIHPLGMIPSPIVCVCACGIPHPSVTSFMRCYLSHSVTALILPCYSTRCELKFRSIAERRQHFQTEHKGEIPVLKCIQQNCPYHCTKQEDLQQHYIDRHCVTHVSLSCQVCKGTSFTSLDDLAFHMRYAHGGVHIEFPDSLDGDVIKTMGHYPEFKFNDMSFALTALLNKFNEVTSLLGSLVEKRTPVPPFVPPPTEKKVKTSRRQNTRSSTSPKPTDSSSETFTCEECQKSWKSEGWYNNHVRKVHTGKR